MIVKIDGFEIECYGPLEEDSNLHIVFDDEEFDGVYTDFDVVEGNWTDTLLPIVDWARMNELEIVEVSAV